MRPLPTAILIGVLSGAIAPPLRPASSTQTEQLPPVQIDYPEDGSVFPPEITPPTFIWRDASEIVKEWVIEIEFADHAPGIHARTAGERLHIGEIDPRTVAATNQPPKLTPEQAAAWSWIPDEAVWAEIKKRSTQAPAKVTITGFRNKRDRRPRSRGAIFMSTSKDPVGAPIFYRDVPLMPSELEKGVIKPLAPAAVPLIAWRLRNVAQPRSRVLVEGLHSCANCHSFSLDGKTLGMDLDGPQNDKGLYAIANIQPTTFIRNEDVISWRALSNRPAGARVGFMSQVSPDGRYVLTSIAGEKDLSRSYYVANFKDYRFLQVFYPTRGVLAWYSRAAGQRKNLPGADDPGYAQINGVWSPDGRYIVFARAKAQDAYPQGQRMAEYANDPAETQVQYDLYRIPFNEGRGGTAEPIEGASSDGMSNSFPKVSPDGRWIVYVRARNGLLMRPDSQLYIVPAEGGVARRMSCNTSRMNSWHSFSPNGRWLVFSSKARSPYTQMYLTHIDEEGRDSPAILIDNSTAANRAVNIPEFVNIPPDGFMKLNVPAADFYARFDKAWDLGEKGRYQDAVAEWQAALAMNPDDARAHNNIGFALAREGNMDDALAHWRKALELNEDYADVRKNLGRALFDRGLYPEAIGHWRKYLEAVPDDLEVRENLGVALLRSGAPAEAIPQLRLVVQQSTRDAEAAGNLGRALLRAGQPDQAIAQFEAALRLDPKDAQAHSDLGVALLGKRGFDEAIRHFREATRINPQFAQAYFNLGNALYLQGDLAGALEQWRAGLAIEPGNAAVLRTAAWILATSANASIRNGAEAVRLSARAVELSGGKDPAILDGLAAAYAEAGRFPEALETARRALPMAAGNNQAALAEGLKSRIAIYEKGQPFRDKR